MARTAFEDALLSYEEEDSGILDYKDFGNRLPSYVVAGDTLSIANGNETFLEQAAQTVDNIKKFIGVSIISGANQIYNIPTSIGNMLPGVDRELSDAADVISGVDSDLGAFYEENKESADLVGFLLSSLVPGVGGVKALNAGQRSIRTAVEVGKAGDNLSKGMKLLSYAAPQKQAAMKRAVAEVRAGTAPAKLANTNARQAIAAGFGQNALEAVAFEVAVSVTMQDSPILENQDFGDFLSNIAWGAGVFGVGGALIDAAKVNSALNKASLAATEDVRPWTYTEAAAKASTPEEQILIDLDQLHNKPNIPEDASPELVTRINQTWETTERKTLNRIRSTFAEITKKDQESAEALHDVIIGADLTTQMQNMRGLVSATRMGTRSREVAKIESAQRKLKKGEFDLVDYDASLEDYLQDKHKIAYLTMYGDNPGNVTAGDRLPTITRMVDTLPAGDKITVDATGVKPGSRDKIYFNTGKNFVKSESKVDPDWDPRTLGSGKQGHEITIMQADARYMWADALEPLMKTLDKSKKAAKLQISMNDIPLLQKLYKDSPDALRDSRVVITGTPEVNTAARQMGLREFISSRKEQLAVDMLRVNEERLAAGYKTTFNQEEIASVLDIRPKMLDGMLTKTTVDTYDDFDLFARASYEEQYSKMLDARGHTPFSGNKGTDFNNTPMHMRLVYDTSVLDPIGSGANGLDNFWVANMSQIKAQQRLYAEDVNRVADAYLGENSKFYNEVLNGEFVGTAITSQMVKEQANAVGAGASGITAASQNYGTLASLVNSLGNATSRVIGDAKTNARNALNGPLNALYSNREAAIEFSVLNARLRNIPAEYTVNDAGDAFVPVAVKRYEQMLDDFQTGKTSEPPKPYELPEGAPMEIPIQNQETRDVIRAHIQTNAPRVEGLVNIRSAQGVEVNRSPEAFYPIPVNPKDFKHFAIVIDNSVTGTGHSKMLYANSAEDLDKAVAKMRENEQFTVLFKKEAEDYYRARGRWEYEKTVNSNYMDTEALRKGVSAPALPPTDPNKIVDDFINWHMDRETGMVREAVSAKFEVQFEELRRLGDEATAAGTSVTSDQSLLKFAEETVKNPYASYIKTALAIDNTSDYPFWLKVNQMADEKVSQVLNAVGRMVDNSNVADDLANVNRYMDQAGFHTAKYDDVEILRLANSRANRGSLSNTVQKANSLLATVVLRWDALNAVNNAVSANVLLGAEAKAVVRAIESMDAGAVGKLTEIGKIAVPGTDKMVLSPTKLIANSIKRYHSTGGREGATMQWYRENGFITSISDQYKEAVDGLTFHSNENLMKTNVNKVHKSLVEAGNKGEKWTGNRFAEEFNRFVAADVMKQLTDIVVDAGKMGQREQIAYINTFVNRTQGNYLASQRPAAFKGPIGQAIGLFQTYQFNLMQQLLRHVGEGHTKDALTLLALQGTIHGMNGLPAFNAVNTHIIGNASGNTAHRDAYDATYGVFGKGAGDLLTYGLASNTLGLIHPDLKINLYTRGDLNPRHVTVVPTNPADIPVVQAASKFFGNLVNVASTLNAGGDISTTLMQGLEHNGISRPLAGLAQTFQAVNNPNYASYSTSKKGNVIAANDFLSLANLSRLVGGKPLDEALAIDASYRFKAYGLKDSARRMRLGKAIKTTILAGNNPTQEQVEDFAQQYAEAGGRQEEFAQWFSQLQTDANRSQVNEIQRSLSSPFTESMQRIMGGRELRDFDNSF